MAGLGSCFEKNEEQWRVWVWAEKSYEYVSEHSNYLSVTLQKRVLYKFYVIIESFHTQAGLPLERRLRGDKQRQQKIILQSFLDPQHEQRPIVVRRTVGHLAMLGMCIRMDRMACE